MGSFILKPKRFKFVIAYDGFDYAGWQLQKDRPTIQGVLEEKLEEIFGHKISIYGSGRTDQGVHAKAQVAHADIITRMKANSIQKALNARLPPAIRVLSVRKVSDDFHARKNVSKKEYRYFIWNGNVVPPFLWRYRLHIPKKLSIGAMQRAATYLKGTHDFSSFIANPLRPVPCKVRTLYLLTVSKKGEEVIIRAQSNGFLYKMVRSIVGYLIRVGLGEETPQAAKEILLSKERTARVPTAPPYGLFLWKVCYYNKKPFTPPLIGEDCYNE